MSDDAYENNNDELDDSENEDEARDKGKDKRSSASRDPVIEEGFNQTAHNQTRADLAADVEAFLARGGQIQQIDDNVMADPPRKPQSSYGSRPI